MDSSMKKHFSLKTVIALMLCASALACVLLLAFIGLYLGLGTDMFGEIRTYIALRRDIRDEYIGTYDGKAVSEAALSASVMALGDQWSYYMTPEEYRDYLNSSNNQYSGLGISVTKDENTGGISVMSVYAGSPAEKSGIAAGEIITAVDGTDITGMALSDATALIDRQLGQTVLLTIKGTDGSTRDVTVEYALIETNPVQYELLDGAVGYIQIKNFEGGAADEFISAADDLIGQGAQSFVFDIRNNGGGKVSELRKMLDYLLPACDIFVAVDKSGNEDVLVSGPENVKLPSVVLVNAYSYSAAEYFAACLREYEYATVVGQQTTGKNRSQITLVLPDGGALHISSGEYLTPNRVSLTEQGGLTPDVEIVLSDADNGLLYSGRLDDTKDTQLRKAIEILKQS
jgi:carboxyl-terminal processing protease